MFMDKNYLSHIAEAKIRYHKSLADIPYEEKLRIIIELQKIDIEMSKNNKKRGERISSGGFGRLTD